MNKRTDSSMYTGTPCDKCGGPTLLLNGGSIWCPDEDAHKGGHFVTRVAFERRPATASDYAKREWSTQPPKRTSSAPTPRSSTPTSKPVKVTTDGFDQGMDGFVRSEK